MRLMPENKARTSGERCSHCGRPVGGEVEQCRPARGGWYCWQRGFILDASQVAPYVPDPIGEAEQAVVDEYAPKIAESQKAVDAALDDYTAAENAWLAATRKAITRRVTGERFNLGNLLLPFREDGRDNEADRRRLDATAAAKDAAGEHLRAVRRVFQQLETRYERARRVARHQEG